MKKIIHWKQNFGCAGWNGKETKDIKKVTCKKCKKTRHFKTAINNAKNIQ